jgi:hypothetical protein
MDNIEKSMNELEKKYEKAEVFGHDLQKKGLKLVNVASRGRDCLERIKQLKDLLNDSNVRTWIVGANATIPSEPPKGYTASDIDTYTMAVGVSGYSANAVFTNLIQGPKDAYKFPFIIPEDLYVVGMGELDECLAELTNEFLKMSDLVAMRKSAWDTFYSTAIDRHLLGAAHLMRTILTKIISELSPNEKVRESEWWVAPKEGEKEVFTVRQRLGYLIFGSKKEGNNDLEDMAEEIVNKCFVNHDLLLQAAHGSEKETGEIKVAMRITELTILTILLLRKIKTQETKSQVRL